MRHRRRGQRGPGQRRRGLVYNFVMDHHGGMEAIIFAFGTTFARHHGTDVPASSDSVAVNRRPPVCSFSRSDFFFHTFIIGKFTVQLYR